MEIHNHHTHHLHQDTSVEIEYMFKLQLHCAPLKLTAKSWLGKSPLYLIMTELHKSIVLLCRSNIGKKKSDIFDAYTYIAILNSKHTSKLDCQNFVVFTSNKFFSFFHHSLTHYGYLHTSNTFIKSHRSRGFHPAIPTCLRVNRGWSLTLVLLWEMVGLLAVDDSPGNKALRRCNLFNSCSNWATSFPKNKVNV